MKRFIATGLWGLSIPFTIVGICLVLTANWLVGNKWADEEVEDDD